MINHTENWYRIHDIDELDTPALVVFPERIKENIRYALQQVGDADRLRPHIKTHKSAAVTLLLLEAGIRHFKCATIAEAELLGSCGAPDVLLAYQPLGPKLTRFIKLIHQFPATRFSCLADSHESLAELSARFFAAALTVPVYIDLNIGMNRTGIVPGPQAEALYKTLFTVDGITAAGFHAYDGHIRTSNLEERTRICDQGFAPVEEMVIRLRQQQYAVTQVVAGGSPSFPIHARREGVQCSPGTFVYWDSGYSQLFPDLAFLPAAVLVTRIVSLPLAGHICTDLGHKSVGAENPIDRRVRFLNATDLTPVGQSEEHLVLETGDSQGYKTGDVLYALPHHICPTVALYESVIPIVNGRTSAEWRTTARDRKITI